MTQHNPLACPRCGYVRGAGCGYDPLTEKEREALLFMNYEISHNVFGEEIARPVGGYSFNVARAELHKVICRPSRFTRIWWNSQQS